MNPREPIGVIFDMDGVLVDSAEPHLESWQLLAKENDRSVTREQFAATFGRQNNDIIPLLFGDVDAQRCAALADRKEEIYRDLVRRAPPIVKGAVDLIQALHERGVRLAVGSSGPSQNIELELDAMGVQELIPVVISGDDVQRGKPDPQVFSLACQGLGVEAVRCVVVEDAPAGIEAAMAAGTRTIAILMHHPAESFENADCIVDRLSDLTPDKIESLVG